METNVRTYGQNLESLMKVGPSWVRQKIKFSRLGVDSGKRRQQVLFSSYFTTDLWSPGIQEDAGALPPIPAWPSWPDCYPNQLPGAGPGAAEPP